MDMAQLSNTLLQIFYIMIGLYMGLTMVFTIKDKNHKTRIGTALFWEYYRPYLCLEIIYQVK